MLRRIMARFRKSVAGAASHSRSQIPDTIVVGGGGAAYPELEMIFDGGFHPSVPWKALDGC
jgi:hypothetical protein